MDLSDWPSPLPRLAAYTRMFKSKMIEKLTADGVSPDRANEEAPLFRRYWTFFWSSEPSEILPGLLLGSVKNAADYAGLVRNGVTTVVNATVAMDHFFESKFEYVRVPMEDTKGAGVPEGEFRKGVAAVAACVEAERPVLVHCFMGASRSVAVVLAYLCWHKGMALDEAYAFVRERRPCAAVNQSFLAWLRAEAEAAPTTDVDALD